MPNEEESENQRTVLRFLVQSGLSPAQSWAHLHKVYGDNSISKSAVVMWHKRFSNGEMSTADKKRSGRPKSATSQEQIDAVCTHLTGDRCRTVREIAQDLGMKKTSVHTIVKKELKLSKLACKFVPKILTDQQKAKRVEICEKNMDLLQNDTDLMETVITGDETWMSVLKMQAKESTRQWPPRGKDTIHPKKLCDSGQRRRPC